METRQVSALLACLLLLAGCGGTHRSDTAAIRAALAASPKTFLHYGASVWGRNPHVQVHISINGDRATARLSVPGTLAQPVTLSRRGGTWSVVSAGMALIKGPRMQRPATPAELAAISAVARRVVFHRRDSCVRYHAQISTLDPRYAAAEYDQHKPFGNCLVGDGVSLFVHGASGWRHLTDASTPFPCDSLPPGVVRSLYGVCFLVR